MKATKKTNLHKIDCKKRFDCNGFCAAYLIQESVRIQLEISCYDANILSVLGIPCEISMHP